MVERLAARWGFAVLVGVVVPHFCWAQAPQDVPALAATHPDTAYEHPELLITGASVFALPFLASAYFAGSSYPAPAATQSDRAALWIPGVGPFLQLGHPTSALGTTLLVLDGVAQLGGLALFVYAIATPGAGEAASSLHVAPLVAHGICGALLGGAF